MATIVEYDDAKVPVNAYPKRIVSPQAPKACCVTQMEQVGAIEQDGGRRFFYKQCKICGFTVRHFLPLDKGGSLWNRWGEEGLAILRDVAPGSRSSTRSSSLPPSLQYGWEAVSQSGRRKTKRNLKRSFTQRGRGHRDSRTRKDRNSNKIQWWD